MRRDAVFRLTVHVERADLHLERLALGPYHGGVQRAVIVRLGLGDVVVKLARQRCPEVVHDAERGVAVLHFVDENAHRADIVERLDARLLAPHLRPDAVDVLGATADLGLDTGGGEFALQGGLHAFDVMLAVQAALVEQASNALVGLGLERAQGKILELPLELPDAESVRQRREQVQRFARGGRAHLVRCRIGSDQVAQRLGALGELDQDDTNVLDHRQQHLAQVLRLQGTLFLGLEVRGGADRAHACGADDDLRHLVAEGLGQRGRVEVRRRRHAEQDRGFDRLRVEFEPGDDRRGAQRAIQPGLAVGRAELAVARACRGERLGDAGALVRRKSGAYLLQPGSEGLRTRARERALARRADERHHGL